MKTIPHTYFFKIKALEKQEVRGNISYKCSLKY